MYRENLRLSLTYLARSVDLLFATDPNDDYDDGTHQTHKQLTPTHYTLRGISRVPTASASLRVSDVTDKSCVFVKLKPKDFLLDL